ncbi:MAG: hypothetical protein U9N86_05915 [Bacteroidota bacterium]|nr:hypothetical protein [Bacteroidota bacterium]
MKRKIVLFAFAFLVIGIASNVIVAEGGGGSTDCTVCYVEENWDYWPDYQEHATGDCYAGGVFCGSIIQCVMGSFFCTPTSCSSCISEIPN